MNVTGTMRGYGRAARYRAEAMGHQMKDRSMQKRLDRATQETERLRFENDLLRDEVEETRTEHRKILDLVEERLPVAEDGRSHKGRWLLLLATLAGAGYAVYRRFQRDEEEWDAAAGGSAPGIRRDAAAA